MNINRDFKVIWWAPEKCATRATAEIFRKLGFEVYNPTTMTFESLNGVYHSHNIVRPEEFSDYKIICNIRNPYDRVLSFYTNFTSVGKNFVYTKDKKHILKNKMERFCLELFQYAIYDNTIVNLEREVPIKNYVMNMSFNEIIPNSFIRMENIVEDMKKIDFIVESDIWKSGWVEQFLDDNKFKIRRPFSFDEVYSFEAANRVFNYFRKHFYLCNYDPFSFTKETMSDEEKFGFIHEIF